MSFSHPQFRQQIENLLIILSWASGCRVVWENSDDGGRVREPNETVGYLKLNSIKKLGIDQVVYKDLEADFEPEDDLLEKPLQEIITGNRSLLLEAKFVSRDNTPGGAAYNAASLMQARLASRYGKDAIAAAELALGTFEDIINLVVDKDDRAEENAILEFRVSTAIEEINEASRNYVIEQLKLSTDLKDASGESLPDELQLTDEVIPP